MMPVDPPTPPHRPVGGSEGSRHRAEPASFRTVRPPMSDQTNGSGAGERCLGHTEGPKHRRCPWLYPHEVHTLRLSDMIPLSDLPATPDAADGSGAEEYVLTVHELDQIRAEAWDEGARSTIEHGIRVVSGRDVSAVDNPHRTAPHATAFELPIEENNRP